MQELRKEFPMLQNHPEMAYFDTASTALTPQVVIDAMNNYYQYHNTNISRGVDKYGYETTAIYESVREKVKNFIGATRNEEIIFTRGTTESLNMIAFGFAKKQLHIGDEIILNIAEHHANLLPWIEVAQMTGAVVKYVDLLDDGSIDLTHLETLLSSKTRIVAFAHVTNVLGSYNNPQTLIRLVRQQAQQAYIIVDGAQGVTQYDVDVQQFDCDFYAFSGHKLFGPTGVGILYGKKELLQQMYPLEFGGDMVAHVNKESALYKELPQKLEAGTMMIAEVFGLGAALDFYQSIDHKQKRAYIKSLRAYAISKLEMIPNILIYNKDNVDAITIVFNIQCVHAHDAASVFSKENIVLRAGHHCAQLLLERLETTSSLRMSLSFYNTKEEIDAFIEAAKKAGDFLDALFG